ncbi:MAG: TIGR02117 family protein [Pseudomonadota bacterium]
MKRLRRLLAVGLALCLGYLLAAAIGGLVPGPVLNSPATEPAGQTQGIMLISGPIHYDIALPLTPATRAAFADLTETGMAVADPNARWLLVGWGAREFYTTAGGYADVSAKAVWRAIVGDASVLRVDLLGEIPASHDFPRIELNAAQYDRLVQAVANSFQRTADGTPVRLGTPGFTTTDGFYAAQGRFSLFRTCNTWVSRVLRASGVAFGVWTPTPYAVTLSLKHFHAL